MDNYEKILKQAEKEMKLLKHPYVGTEHLLLSLLSYKNLLSDLLKENKLTYTRFKRKLISIIGESTRQTNFVLYTPMLRNVLQEAMNQARVNKQDINEIYLFLAIIKQGEGIAYRVMEALKIDMNKINDDLVMEIRNDFMVANQDKLVGRDYEIDYILQTLLRKNKCNPLLIGKAGVGKTAIVEEISRRLEKNEVPQAIKNYRIINVDLSELIAGTKYRGDFEEKLNNLLKEIKGKKIILFIDEIHMLVNAGGADGAISAGEIFKPYLARGEIKCIGATTIKEYNSYIKKDEALDRRFQTIVIEEPSLAETINILKKVKNNYEQFHHIKIEESVIEKLCELSDKYFRSRANPDRSLELLDSLLSYGKFKNKNVVTINDLYLFIENKYGIKYLNNKEIKRWVEEHKNILCKDNDQTYQLIKQAYRKNLFYNINLDCYKTIESTYQLLGYPNNNNNFLFSNLKNNPFGVVIIKNINVNSCVNELLIKIIKERTINDNCGDIIDFNNVLFIGEESEQKQSIGFCSYPQGNELSKLFEETMICN